MEGLFALDCNKQKRSHDRSYQEFRKSARRKARRFFSRTMSWLEPGARLAKMQRWLNSATTAGLLDKAQVRSESFDFVRAQRARNRRHWICGRMISSAPFFEPPLQVEIGQSSET
ncbi:hypothetical protein, partial [Bradyrhizobium sp.]|uniref:hypothetical protein n=1 Tax=Bradyrhizobium sp. TaxID=376 RepID=UPI0025BD52B2